MSFTTNPGRRAGRRYKKFTTSVRGAALLLAFVLIGSACGTDALSRSTGDAAAAGELELVQAELELQRAQNEQLLLEAELAAAAESEAATTTTTEPAPTTTAPPATTAPPKTTVPPETVPPETLPPETLPPETVPPTTAPAPEPQIVTRLEITEIVIAQDCDGIEGDGDFQLKASARIEAGDQKETYTYPATWHTLGDGDKVTIGSKSALTLVSDGPARVNVTFTSIERDENIFGDTWNDERMEGGSSRVEFNQKIFSDTESYRAFLSTGSGACRATLWFSVEVETVS